MNVSGLVRPDPKLEAISAPPNLRDGKFPVQTIQQTPVQRAVRTLQDEAWIIAACITLACSLTLLYAAHQPRMYQAIAKIAIYRDNKEGFSLGKELGPLTGDADDYSVNLETQLHILKSRSLALGVVRKLGLNRLSEFRSNQKRLSFDNESKEAFSPTNAESEAMDVLLAGLSANPIKQTRVIEVSFVGRSPGLSASVVNTLVADFIEDSVRSRYEASNHAAKLLSAQLNDIRTKVQDSQERLVKYKREHEIVGVDEKENVVTARLDDLNKQLTTAQADRIEREALYQTVLAGSFDEIPESKTSAALQNLRLREAELKNEYAQANTIDGPNHPRVLELSSQLKSMEASIQSELRRLAGRAQQEYQASVRRERKLRALFDAQKNEANRLSESAIQYQLLKWDVDSNRQLYDSLQQHLKEAGVTAGLRSANIRIIDSAEKPALPISPNFPKSASLGLFLGFLASAAVIGVRKGMDRSLNDPAQVDSFTSTPSLAVIPERLGPGSKMLGVSSIDTDVVCLSQPRSAIAEAYRALGTSILLSPKLKTLLVTSSLPGEGKTSTAANTAVVIAQQGKQVLLVDADLRKPALHLGFGLSNDLGLSNVLLDKINVEAAIRCSAAVNGLSIMTAGPAQSLPAELLGSSKMRELMASWREQYDYVVVDTPPVLAVTDAVRVSSLADSVLVVFRCGDTPRDALSRACDLLNQAQAPVLGFVVNRVTSRAAGSYYYGAYPGLAKKYFENRVPRV